MKRLQSESGLNYLTDTLTSAWDAMRANFGVSQKSAAPHGWLTRHRWPYILIFILACIFADPYIGTLLSLKLRPFITLFTRSPLFQPV